MINQILTVITSVFLALNFNSASGQVKSANQTILSTREFSLDQRYAVASVNEVMKKNILLNLAYLNGSVKGKSDISWDKLVNEPFKFDFTLKPGQTFAYHDDILPQYQDSLVLTTKSYFGPGQGYLSDGYLYGDGVCHLASLINWAARDAGLEVYVPKDHRSVGPINQVPADYGVSIYVNPETGVGERNNLYVTNDRDQDINFEFDYDGSDLTIRVTEAA